MKNIFIENKKDLFLFLDFLIAQYKKSENSSLEEVVEKIEFIFKNITEKEVGLSSNNGWEQLGKIFLENKTIKDMLLKKGIKISDSLIIDGAKDNNLYTSIGNKISTLIYTHTDKIKNLAHLKSFEKDKKPSEYKLFGDIYSTEIETLSFIDKMRYLSKDELDTFFDNLKTIGVFKFSHLKKEETNKIEKIKVIKAIYEECNKIGYTIYKEISAKLLKEVDIEKSVRMEIFANKINVGLTPIEKEELIDLFSELTYRIEKLKECKKTQTPVKIKIKNSILESIETILSSKLSEVILNNGKKISHVLLEDSEFFADLNAELIDKKLRFEERVSLIKSFNDIEWFGSFLRNKEYNIDIDTFLITSTNNNISENHLSLANIYFGNQFNEQTVKDIFETLSLFENTDFQHIDKTKTKTDDTTFEIRNFFLEKISNNIYLMDYMIKNLEKLKEIKVLWNNQNFRIILNRIGNNDLLKLTDTVDIFKIVNNSNFSELKKIFEKQTIEDLQSELDYPESVKKYHRAIENNIPIIDKIVKNDKDGEKAISVLHKNDNNEQEYTGYTKTLIKFINLIENEKLNRNRDKKQVEPSVVMDFLSF